LITSSDDDCFTISIDVAASPTFIAWLFQFGDKLKILSSDTLAQEMKTTAEKVAGQYL